MCSMKCNKYAIVNTDIIKIRYLEQIIATKYDTINELFHGEALAG